MRSDLSEDACRAVVVINKFRDIIYKTESIRNTRWEATVTTKTMKN